MKVRYERDGTIGKIILNSGKNNPLDNDTLVLLIKKFRLSAKYGDICVLFTAEGVNFTVGADLKSIASIIKNNEEQKFEEFSRNFQELTRAMQDHPGIIIAGLHGWTIGGGFEITLSADLRIASRNTRIKLPELSIATMFSNGSTKLLSEIIGLGRAKEIMLLGKEIDINYAYQIGLINKLCEENELEKDLNDYANYIAKNLDPKAVKVGKKLLNDNIGEPMENVLQKELDALIKFGNYKVFRDNILSFSGGRNDQGT